MSQYGKIFNMDITRQKAVIIFITFVAVITALGLILVLRGVKEISEEASPDNLNITIVLNKALFSQGEDININIQNNDLIDITLTNIEVQQYIAEKDKWKTANKDIRCPCYAQCEDIRHVITPGKKENFFWQQDTNKWESDIITKGITLPECDKVKDGIYRAKIKYFEDSKDAFLEKAKIIYSDSFSIK